VFFPGDAYLECIVPSIRDILRGLSGTDLVNSTEQYHPFYLGARVAPGNLQPYNPVFTHLAGASGPDVRFGIADTYGSAQLQADFAGYLSRGPSFSFMPGQMLDLRTAFVLDPVDGYCFHHTVNIDEYESIDIVPFKHVGFYVDTTPLLIGHDPLTGSFLEGQIDALSIDPGNFINVH
jgi:hypothetical protein